MARILYKFPTRERPEKCFATIENIISNSLHDDYFIWLTCDIDDKSMTDTAVRDRLTSIPNVHVMYGTSKSKVDACNRDMALIPIDWDICVLISDDMRWNKPGFDKIIISAFQNNFPDYDGAVHIPDQKAREQLITLCIVGREYYKRFGYLYHPDYVSVYCDNEFTEVARLLNKYFYVDDNSLLTHAHAIWGYGVADALLKRTEDPTNYAKDRETYMRRKLNNFGII